MANSSQDKTSRLLRVAVFGSTGGSGKAAVEEILKAGHHVTALVRSPPKLLQMLGLPDCPANLSIIQGMIVSFVTCIELGRKGVTGGVEVW
jgi:nucleoside-diphosphate-sugar epimerase